MAQLKKKIWFFRYDTWSDKLVYLPQTWYGFKRYYELNGRHADSWEWIPPVISYHQWTIDEIIQEALSCKADVYMFSSYMWSWEIIRVVASAIKDELPNSVIVLGGPHQHTTYSQPFLYFKEHPYFDVAARPSEYGEYFITDMLDQLFEGDIDWSTVRGSFYRKGYGPEGNKREFKYPPDVIRANIDHAREISKYANNIGSALGIMYETNRGCMYKCIYCEWGGGTNTKVVIKDLDNIKDDISFFRELNINTTWITDANFGILPRDPEIAKLFSSQNDYMKFVGITGLAKSKVEKRQAVLEPLIQSGLVTLYQLSIQTVDQQILDNILRTDIPLEDNIGLAKKLIETYDIDVIVELILGLPGMKVETFYKETALEYTLLNSVKPHTHHVPLYVLPDSPVANPAYLEKYQIKLAPIAIDESMELLHDANSKYVQQFKSKNFKLENTLHIPISSYSYSVEDWKEMFFMNDMNHVLMNMIMVTPFIDFLHFHKNIPLDIIFKKIFVSVSSVDEFYQPIYQRYLTPLANGEYKGKSWRQFESGPVTGGWSAYSSYTWLWTTNKDNLYRSIRTVFAEYIDEQVDDCLTYCKNSTFKLDHDIVWENKWRWDLWEEAGAKHRSIPKESIKFTTKSMVVDWEQSKELYRNMHTYKFDTNERIKMKMFQLSRAGTDNV
jgi:radical SAM superfamily enzyme YgiQ (UPF0313 family)